MVAQSDTALYDLGKRLAAVQQAVAEMAGGAKMAVDPTALRDAVRQIRQAIAAVEGACAVFVGGLAVQNLGYERWTEDIDVLVDADHFNRVLDELRQRGFVLAAGSALRHKATGVELDLLKEGSSPKAARVPFPHPREIGPHGGYATLGGIIRLKLASGRQQDWADVVELLKRHGAEADAVQAVLPAGLREQFQALREQALREMEGDNWKRAP